MIEVTEEVIQKVLQLNTKPSEAFTDLAKVKAETFHEFKQRKPNVSEMKHIYASSYAEIFCNFHE